MGTKRKISKSKAVDEIVVLLENGYTTQLIVSEFCSNFHLTERTIYNYLKEAKQKHTAKQIEIEKELMNVDVESKKESRKREILGILDIQETLSKIIVSSNESTTDKLKAVSELNRMLGAHDSDKLRRELTENNNVSNNDLIKININV